MTDKDKDDQFDWEDFDEDEFWESLEKGVGKKDDDRHLYEDDTLDIDDRYNDFLNDDHWADMALWGGGFRRSEDDDSLLPEFAGKSWANKHLLTIFEGITDLNRTTFREGLATKLGLMAYESLAMDVFNSLFKTSTILKKYEMFEDIEEPILKKQLSIHRGLLKSLKNSENFHRIKDPCTLNLIFSKELSSELSEKLLEIYRMFPDIIECAADESPNPIQQDMFDPSTGGESWGTNTAQAIIGVQLENIIKGLEVKVNSLTRCLNQWGISNDYLKSLPVDSQIKVHNIINNSFHQDLMDLSTKFMQNSGGRLKTTKTTKLVRTTIKFGNNLQCVVSRDRLLAIQNKNEFIRKYAEGSLTMLIGHKSVGKGPIVCAIDDSGSMDPPAGQRARWARALFMSLANASVKNDRALYACLFSSRVECEVDLPPKIKKEKRMADAFDFVDRRLGGGTSFVDALRWSFKKLGTSARKGDIVFITDGECRLSPQQTAEFTKKKEQEKCKVLVVIIGPTGRYEEHSLSVLADKTYHLNIDYHSKSNILNDVKTMQNLLKEATE